MTWTDGGFVVAVNITTKNPVGYEGQHPTGPVTHERGRGNARSRKRIFAGDAQPRNSGAREGFRVIDVVGVDRNCVVGVDRKALLGP